MKTITRFPFVLIILFVMGLGHVSAQELPEPLTPPRLVNDFAGILTSDEVYRLEEKLLKFNDSTSTQIAVITVKSLNGYDVNDCAQRRGQNWGIVKKGKKNGVVIVINPKY